MVITNVVNTEKLREIQTKTLEELSGFLKGSFGPNGTSSIIKRGDVETIYSKDGHTILSNIRYSGIIETSITEDIQNITRHIVKNVGDGTTSAVILSQLLFMSLNKIIKEENVFPSQIINSLDSVVKNISEQVESNSTECTLDDIYNIAMIATNGNTKVSKELYEIYKNHGMSVFIDVAISTTTDTVIKEYDGMTLDRGFFDIAFTNKTGNISEIKDPNIYIFEDHIDTTPMINMMNTIIKDNILVTNPKDLKPTVIVAPKISKDVDSYLDHLISGLLQHPLNSRPPILIISNVTGRQSELLDIAQMTGAKPIKKYIDPRVQEHDIAQGLAPTPETIHSFAGKSELVISDSSITKFIKPDKMFNEDGTYSELFNNVVSYLEVEIEKLTHINDLPNRGSLKRRLNALKNNLIEYLVGGVAAADRDNVRDLVEDAVLNCRSAATYGVGQAANYETLKIALKSVDECTNSEKDKCLNCKIMRAIYESYMELSCQLYNKNEDTILKYLEENKGALNIRTGEFDGTVLASIKSDIVILEAVSKIVSLMVTSNQFILPNATFNVYI